MDNHMTPPSPEASVIESAARAVRNGDISSSEVAATLERAGQIIRSLNSLALDMGRVIRATDEAGEHSEFWTQDGGYIIDSRFPK